MKTHQIYFRYNFVNFRASILIIIIFMFIHWFKFTISRSLSSNFVSIRAYLPRIRQFSLFTASADFPGWFDFSLYSWLCLIADRYLLTRLFVKKSSPLGTSHLHWKQESVWCWTVSHQPYNFLKNVTQVYRLWPSVGRFIL